MRFLLHDFFQLLVRQPKGTEIHPLQVGAFQIEDSHFRQFLRQELLQRLMVVPDQSFERLQPVLGCRVGDLCRLQADNIGSSANAGHFHIHLESRVELRIRNDDIGIAQARDIEGLAGGGCRDADVRG